MEQAINELYEKADELFSYHVGDEIILEGDKYYVIYDSSATQDYVTLLKYDVLSATIINTYGSNYVNKYTQSSVGTAKLYANVTGYIAYYTSETCGYVDGNLVTDGCTTDYNDSDIKHVIDNWANDLFGNNLKEVDGYKARLLTLPETTAFGCTASAWKCNEIVGGNSNLYGKYWLMTPHPNSSINYMWLVNNNWTNTHAHGVYEMYAVKPVINIKKSAITKANNN